MKAKKTKAKKTKANERRNENEAWEMFSTSKLVEELMKRDRLTVDLMAEETGRPVQYFIEIIRHLRDINQEDALLFERCFGWSAVELLEHQIHDKMARLMALIDILKIWRELFKQEIKWREGEAEIKKLLALIEKI